MKKNAILDLTMTLLFPAPILIMLLTLIDGVKLAQNLRPNALNAITKKDVLFVNSNSVTTLITYGQLPELEKDTESVTKWTAL